MERGPCLPHGLDSQDRTCRALSPARPSQIHFRRHLDFSKSTHTPRGTNEPEPDKACQWLIKVIDCGKGSWTAFFDLIAFIDITCRIHQEPTKDASVDFWLTENFEVSRNLVFTGWVLVNTDNSARFHNVQTESQAKRYGLWKGRPQMPWQSKAVQ